MDFNKKDVEIKVKTELSNEYSKKVSRFTNKNVSAKGTTIDAQEKTDGLKPGFMDFWSTSRKSAHSTNGNAPRRNNLAQ